MAKAPLRIADALGFGGGQRRDLTQSYRQAISRPAPASSGSIKSGRATLSRRIAEALTPNTRAGAEYADKIAGLLDMITPAGAEEPLVQARGAAGRGDYGQAALQGALGILSGIPGAGKVGGKVAKEAAETAAERGIIAYHGSPHSFDRFSLSKIGTGEGAQAYGHGLYFAEAEDVARSYKDALERPYYKLKTGENAAEKFGSDTISAFDAVGGEPEEIKETIKRLRNIVKRDLSDFGVSSVSELKPVYEGDLASQTINHARRADNLESLLNSGELELANKGSMYQVRINANPEDFADWDKPFFEQPKSIQDAIEYAFGPQPTFGRFGSYSMDKPREMHTRLMSEKGVKGIKYLDQGSRGAGEGSSNYVVFDDALIDILKKYGIAIPAIAGGGLLATQPQQDGGL